MTWNTAEGMDLKAAVRDLVGSARQRLFMAANLKRARKYREDDVDAADALLMEVERLLRTY